MATIKSSKKYHFSVEGETEQWYLEWLQRTINSLPESTFKVSFDCPIQKNPLKRAKSLAITSRTDIYHLSDYESDDPIHEREFLDTISNMKKAKELGKQITYKFGYSNLTFDLWIILHRADCNGSITHRKNYLSYLNRAFDERFESMDDYKHKQNFQRCLNKLQISDVVDAIKRAENIMKTNRGNGYTLHEYKGYKYYKENPSLAVCEVVSKILVDCDLM